MITRLTLLKRPWLTRGRLLVGLPLGLGVVVSAVLLGSVLPVFQAIRDLEASRDDLRSLQRSLPALERQLAQAEGELLIAQDKQAQLLGLLAGRDSVQTFLALLNQQAAASGVQIQRYEPLKSVLPESVSEQSQSGRNSSRSKSKKKAEPPKEPMQVLGYRKLSVALEVAGPYVGLQSFLRRMEALELLVASSNLSLHAIIPGKEVDERSLLATNKLSLELMFYDFVPEIADRLNVAGSNKEAI